MKVFDSRVYSINDFVEWNAQKALELAPKFQRRSVWSPAAKCPSTNMLRRLSRL